VHGTIETLFDIEWRPLAELAAIAQDWRALAARAVEPNVFYEPAFALAAAPVFGARVGAGLVWSRAAPRRLVGFFPAYIDRRRYGVPLAVLVGWTHPFAPLGTPLIDRDAVDTVVAAWLAHIAGDARLPKTLLLPYLPSDGIVSRAFDAALARRDGATASFELRRRAALVPSGDRSTYLTHAIGGKKRKELRRQRNRLAESGTLTSRIASDPASMAGGLADFLKLEAGGWKGHAGTAASQRPEIVQFMTSAVSALAAEHKADIARLALGDGPIAALVILRSSATAWIWKIAYDERYARFSPGVQIVLDATQRLLADSAVAQADSCANADHPMIDHVWRERLLLADRLIGVGPAPARDFALARRLEHWRRSAIAAAKALRNAIKRP